MQQTVPLSQGCGVHIEGSIPALATPGASPPRPQPLLQTACKSLVLQTQPHTRIVSSYPCLYAAGVPFILLEASDGVGGRVRTDSVDGFLLDRGFQIFLTSYPECRVACLSSPLRSQRRPWRSMCIVTVHSAGSQSWTISVVTSPTGPAGCKGSWS
jgi:Flavin containing amine oxidoreductase